MTIFFLVVSVSILVFLFNLVRSRRLREKYVALWMLVGLVIVALTLFPRLLFWLSHLVGVQLPSNLLFALAIFLLLGVTLQLSLEVSKTEEKARTLAEHVAILNLQITELTGNQMPAHTDDELTPPIVPPAVPSAAEPVDTDQPRTPGRPGTS